MKYRRFHSWRVSPKKAIAIQRTLAKKLVRVTRHLNDIGKIAAADVSFRADKCCAAVCVYSYPDFVLIEQKTEVMRTVFPYIPTLLTFREGPVVLKCIRKIKTVPDVVLFDGQGIAHPRRMGLAAHIGLWLGMSTIGCAKTPLFGSFRVPALRKGSYSPIMDGNTVIGAAVRTRDNTNPVFVSQGYRITLKDAIRISVLSCTRYKIPEPLRGAHTLSKSTLKSSP